MNDEIQCSHCKYGKTSHTVLIGGKIILEWYCGLTNTDEYCGGDDFEEDE